MAEDVDSPDQGAVLQVAQHEHRLGRVHQPATSKIAQVRIRSPGKRPSVTARAARQATEVPKPPIPRQFRRFTQVTLASGLGRLSRAIPCLKGLP